MKDKIMDLLLFMKEETEYSVNRTDGKVNTIIVWIPFWKIGDFNENFPASVFDEGGVEGVRLQEDAIALDIKDMLECSFDYEEVEYIIKKLEEWQ